MGEWAMPEAYEYLAGARSCLRYAIVLEFTIPYTRERKPRL